MALNRPLKYILPSCQRNTSSDSETRESGKINFSSNGQARKMPSFGLLSANEKLRRREIHNREKAQSLKDRKKAQISDFEVKNESLQAENARIKSAHNFVKSNYESLKLDHDNLKLKNTTLEGELKKLLLDEREGTVVTTQSPIRVNQEKVEEGAQKPIEYAEDTEFLLLSSLVDNLINIPLKDLMDAEELDKLLSDYEASTDDGEITETNENCEKSKIEVMGTTAKQLESIEDPSKILE